MKKTIAIGVSATALLVAAQANAADVYGPAGGYKDGPAYVSASWTGFYLGVNGGYGWSPYSDQLADRMIGDTLGGNSPSGGFGGGQLGYNFQRDSLVFGIETDIQGSGIGDKKFDTAGNRYYTNSSLDWFGSLRGRIGYASSQALVYGTGGLAYGGIRNRVDYSSQYPSDIFDINRTAVGYTVGGGIEFKVNPAWSVKAEYQYINLGTNDPVRAGDGRTYGSYAAVGTKLDDDAFHTVRLGVNYRLVPAYEPLK